MTYQNTAKSQGSNVSTPLSLAAYDQRKKPLKSNTDLLRRNCIALQIPVDNREMTLSSKVVGHAIEPVGAVNRPGNECSFLAASQLAKNLKNQNESQG